MTIVPKAEMRESTAEAGLFLDVRDLSVAYQAGKRMLVALREVSLRVGVGELAGLVGPNGCGKTTLIRTATKVVQPLSGEIRVCGDDVGSLSQVEIARRVAVVPQEPLLPEAFTALDCVLMGRAPHLRLLENEGARDFEAAREAMVRTDTWELADRRVGELSGGERQRVVVARALAQETPLLLLDEPTAHLDIGHQGAVLRLMRSLCRDEGKAVLVVDHDLHRAAEHYDRLALLNQRLVAYGPSRAVFTPDLLRATYAGRLALLEALGTGGSP